MLFQTPAQDKRFCIYDLLSKQAGQTFDGEQIPFRLNDEAGPVTARVVRTPPISRPCFSWMRETARPPAS